MEIPKNLENEAPVKRGRLRKIGNAVSSVLMAPSELLMPWMPEPEHDRDRAPGEPTLAQKLGSDVISVRIGPKPIDHERNRLAADAIRKLRDRRSY